MGGKYWRPRDRIFLTSRAAAVFHKDTRQKSLNLITALQSLQSGVAAVPRQTARQLQLQIRSEQSSQFCICRSSSSIFYRRILLALLQYSCAVQTLCSVYIITRCSPQHFKLNFRIRLLAVVSKLPICEANCFVLCRARMTVVARPSSKGRQSAVQRCLALHHSYC